MKIYLIKSLNDGIYKIGVSKNPEKRIKQLQTGNSSQLQLLNVYETVIPFKVEKVLHSTFQIDRKEGEWFYLSIKDELDFLNQCNMIEKNLLHLIKEENKFI
jgi:hypothetical protein